MRRKLAVLLTLCITAAAANYPAGINIARAGEVQEAEIARVSEGDFEYEELENGNLKLTRYEGSGTEAVIPSTINGKAVTMIGNEVFSGCTNLASITIPENVTNIGEGTRYTEYDVFDECSGLKEIIVDAGNVWYSSQDGVLYNEKKTQLILCPAGKEGSVAIAEGVTGISYIMTNYNTFGYSAFSYCSSLTGIMIPESLVTFIKAGDTAGAAPYQIFSNCSSLEEILVDSNNAAYSSQDGILYNKEKTKLLACPEGKKGSVAIPANVRDIGQPYAGNNAYYNIFLSCKNLTDILVDDGNAAYSSQDGILYNKAKTELICCPAGKTGSVAISEGVTEIRKYAFSGCVGLTEITVPAGITAIEEYTFNDCSSLAEITIPDGVETIGNGAFNGCSSLMRITIPKSVVQIAQVDGIHPDAEWGPAELSGLANCDSLMEIIVDSNNRAYSSQDGILYNKDMTELILCPAGMRGSVTIPNGVSLLRDNAFPINNRLTEILAGNNDSFYSYDGALYLGRWLRAFPAAKEGAVKIPAGVEKIDSNKFYNCNNLTEFIVDRDNESFYSLDGVLYRGKKGKTDELLRCPPGKEGDIVLPEDGRYSIEYKAFKGCDGLASIRIPEMSAILDNAFSDCGEDFHIYCVKGSKAESYAVKHGISYTARKRFCGIYVDIETWNPDEIYNADKITVGDNPFWLMPNAWIYDDNGDENTIDAVFTYESSDDSVVSVSQDGLVTIVGAGTAQITITVPETEECEAARKELSFTVSPKPGGDQKPGGTQKPEAGGSSQEKPENKKAQTVTAADLAKTYGDRPFSIGAKSSGGGALSYAVKNPAVASVDGNGAVTLKCCGVTEIVITAAANGRYQAASKTITLTVAPKKLSGTSAKSTKAKTLTVKWKKDKAATGYIIECSTDKKFRKNVKTATVKKNKTVSKKLTNLKGGKRYYVRACAYVQAGGAKIKGAYRTIKKAVKVKK